MYWYWLPSIDWKSVTAIVMIINFCVFLAWQVMPEVDMAYFFIAFPGFVSPGLFLANISHESLYHILWNMYLLLILWPIIESWLSQKKYIWLLVVSGIVTSLWIYFFSDSPTLWFSWVGLGLIAFAYFSDSIYMNKQQLLMLLVINIVIWFAPWISLVWHMAWAVWWALYALALKKNN